MDTPLHVPGQKPTIGILTIEDNKRIFRGNHHNFLDIVRVGKELDAEVYIVPATNLKLTSKRVIGYRYDFDKKRWRKELVPTPHVIYNRIPYRKMEMLPEVQQTLQACLRSNQVKLFNPYFFNKWTLFEWLSKSSKTRPYIPATQQLISQNDLERLLRVHPTVYLKPVKGKAGRGIMKLERLSTKNKQPEYQLCLQDNKTMNIFRFNSLDQIWKEITELRGHKEYIAQQGIALTSYKKRAYDLRALVQKTGRGNWSVTGVGARVAGKLSITTHVPRGGSIDDPHKLLTSAFGQQEAVRILKRTKAAALTLAKQIERSSGYQLGEMSMDLGVDTSGRIWFFEANSKPMKFDEPEIRRKSLQRIIRYSLFLIKTAQRR